MAHGVLQYGTDAANLTVDTDLEGKTDEEIKTLLDDMIKRDNANRYVYYKAHPKPVEPSTPPIPLIPQVNVPEYRLPEYIEAEEVPDEPQKSVGDISDVQEVIPNEDLTEEFDQELTENQPETEAIPATGDSLPSLALFALLPAAAWILAYRRTV